MIAAMTKTRLAIHFSFFSSLLVWLLYSCSMLVAIVTKPCTSRDRCSCRSAVDGQHPLVRDNSTRSSLTYLNCWGTLAPGGGDGSIVTVSLLNFVQLKLCLDWDPSLKGFDLVVLVRVDNETFTFLGYDPTLTQVDLTSAVVSPTQIVLSAKAGHTDWVKQSIPLSYMSLTPKSLDDAAHSVQVYSDLSAGG
ncbi:hypothetical protein EDB89DRAFT_59077 [Lactarius sanguifluus]|nr:hypothetical protein EDB89DRAFT_59077 [Lactarius sanguifluus]